MDRMLIQLFKEFFEKTCLSLVKQNYGALKQWLYFSSMLSQDFLDYSKIQKYVHGLPSTLNSLTDYSGSKSPSTKLQFQRKTSLNENIINDIKQDDLKFIKLLDDVTIPTSASLSAPVGLNSQYHLSSQTKDPLKSLEATKQILFGLNNLHLMFVEHQYEFEFPKKQKQENCYEQQTPYRIRQLDENLRI